MPDVAKWERIPNSRFDRYLDIDDAYHALREAGIYMEIRKRYRYDDDGQLSYGWLEAKMEPDKSQQKLFDA